VAKHDHLLNGLLSGTLAMILGIYSLARGDGHGPLAWRIALIFLITPFCALAGGWLARPPRRRTRAA
jgi:hypothetical protein